MVGPNVPFVSLPLDLGLVLNEGMEMAIAILVLLPCYDPFSHLRGNESFPGLFLGQRALGEGQEPT